jgi:hypothetical protein
VLDGVCVVWAGLLEKPLEVLHRRPRRAVVTACGSQDAPHTRATHLATFVPLVATFDALMGAVSGDVRRCLRVTTRCHLPASLCRAKHGLIIAVGVLGGDAARLLKHAPEEVIMSALPRALCMAFEQCNRTTLVNLEVNLWFTALYLPLPWQGLGREVSRG